MSELEKLVEQLSEQGPRQFAAWSQEAFDAYIEGPVKQLGQYLEWQDKEKPDPNSVENLVRLVFEGIGAGWLKPKTDDAPATTFLAHCLWTLVPYQLGQLSLEERGIALQKVWNIGEGLAREPQWLNQFAITRTDWQTELINIDTHLEKALAPALTPMDSSDWSGKLKLQVIDLRQRFDEFVPGRMYLAAPAVLCLEDRTSPSETVALLLQRKGNTEILGSVGKLPEHEEPTSSSLTVEALENGIRINGCIVDAPLIHRPRQTIAVSSGFVAVTAEDSQRLWLVEAT